MVPFRRRPRPGAWLPRLAPANLDPYVNLHDIMYIVAERQ